MDKFCTLYASSKATFMHASSSSVKKIVVPVQFTTTIYYCTWGMQSEYSFPSFINPLLIATVLLYRTARSS